MALKATRKVMVSKDPGHRALTVGDIRMLADVLNEQNVPDEFYLKHADMSAIGIEY